MKRPSINNSNFVMPDPDDFVDKKPVFSSFMQETKEPKKKGEKKQFTIYLSLENFEKIKNYCKLNKITQSELIDTYISNLKI